MRLALAAATCTVIPILVALAYIDWRKGVRLDLAIWRHGAGLTSMFIVFALWLIQTARWVVMAAQRESTGFLESNLIEVETFLPAFYRHPALLLALALKRLPRLQMVAAWLLLAVFYGTFWYT